MATIKDFWHNLHPLATGILGGTFIFGGLLFFAIMLDVMDGSANNWLEMKRLLVFAWLLGIVVVTLASYKIPPEVLERLKALKEGRIG